MSLYRKLLGLLLVNGRKYPDNPFFFLFSLLIFNFKNGGGVVFRSKNTRHCDTAGKCILNS